ncbi:uncharacterized protein YpuA (DUF1002 family) [Caldalkalibacillus uzonensis]|uniref:Uncharacterized protein YpuA (DUF1002 family) n=1 Tax=Caldalkalibacillus uzonensis TaxID=353224 RepID=A0ABU0CUJ3_9BACI|nr:DUF1002 domain-containing protein [Caldalkalibacillus uzonensis]MDQ0340087.1 uncharacterized protein YpuA (DUF1002 family) [Caldalkalibacillus uzonensis]
MLWMMEKPYKKWLASLALFTLLVFSFVLPVSADAITGETVVTLGENLTQEQRQQILAEMGVGEDVEIIYVSNQEEHQYLGQYIDEKTIGTRAISSARITLLEEGAGLTVSTNNIDWVTEEMYANAMATAGIQDADVYVTAPFGVSGTAGLTGIIKAFEAAADIEIDEEQKQVANEEMVTTAELADKIGSEEAAELMRRLKERLADTKLETDEDYRNLIREIAAELGIELTEEDIDALVHLLKRLKSLDINWEQVSNQLKNIRDNLNEILDREETRNFLRKVLDVIIAFFERLKDVFSS